MNCIYFNLLAPLFSFIISIMYVRFHSIKKFFVYFLTFITFSSFISSVFLFQYQEKLHFKKNILHLWTLLSFKKNDINIDCILDQLSITMLVMILGIGCLVHLFSLWYIQKKNEQIRFFTLITLFIFSMSVLVLSDNLLSIYFGWEGVGLCSYLLIGFYYTSNKNINAAKKSFLMTKIGDVFFFLSILLIYKHFHSLSIYNISLIADKYSSEYSDHCYILHFITLFLLIGSISKSAQFPLHTWLIDAMVGPTAASALIHAATMVTAGVYLINRTKSIFLTTPEILFITGCLGIITLLISGFYAIFQNDIKCILAYSTMSQIGYMFVALGVHSWRSSIFHLLTHAIFKALLFLSTASLIFSASKERNIFKIHLSKKSIPIIYTSFLFGVSSLLAIPYITIGFYSKEALLYDIVNYNNKFFYIGSILGVFFTSIYISRLFFVLFYKENCKVDNLNKSIINSFHNFPLFCLMFCSTSIGLHILLRHYSLQYIYIDNNAHNVYLKISLFLLSMCGVFFSYVYWVLEKSIVSIYMKKMFSYFNFNLFFQCSIDKLYQNSFIYFFKFILKKCKKNIFIILSNKFMYLYTLCNSNVSYYEKKTLRFYINCFIFIITVFLLMIFI
ncbi:NADH-quinone oxidoreductase subunit L [Buchnera aphidicola (Thelaxes californica)]|uniref:NADH-quinone oxidoreductase subunit L n=1 Tax=Buchnera aphidicola (Thelaxes californica) TaxID=1315998 RepID=A0A4D6YL31_9GAMM|nr:NADH-quinone oxidoreductase subunit L [Buchnera aphidicola]QCI26684.1 NADH-quinone oxidoreductase subunit L [Buchnera aphidicola (Thelaxes californica)]